MYQLRRKFVSVVAVLLALLMAGGLTLNAFAESSSTIKARIESLKEQEEEIAAQKAEAKAQREANESEIDNKLVDFKVTIARFDAVVVADEVDQAIETEKEMERLARKELRAAKKEERKDKREAKKAELSAEFASFKSKFKKD